MKAAFGVDMMQKPKGVDRNPCYVPKLVKWDTQAEVLKMAAHDNGELLALCDLRNPYPGTLGVVGEGALADLVLVDGIPISGVAPVAWVFRNSGEASRADWGQNRSRWCPLGTELESPAIPGRCNQRPPVNLALYGNSTPRACPEHLAPGPCNVLHCHT